MSFEGRQPVVVQVPNFCLVFQAFRPQEHKWQVGSLDGQQSQWQARPPEFFCDGYVAAIRSLDLHLQNLTSSHPALNYHTSPPTS